MAIPERRAEQIAAFAAVLLLASAAFAVLRPFVVPILWAFVIALASWPAFERALVFTGGRRTIAAAVMLAALAIGLLLPVALAGLGLSRSVPTVVGQGRALLTNPPDPPAWLLTTPVLDTTVGAVWQQVASDDFTLGETLEPYAGRISSFLLDVATGIGNGLFQLGLSLLIVFFLYRDGDFVAEQVRRLFARVAGSRAERLLREAHGTMIGVLYGIIGTALIQGALAAFGFWIADLPAPFLLGMLAAIVAPIPWGVGLVVWPAALWLASEGAYGAAIFVFIWGIAPVGVVDNVVRPLFVRRSSRLPFVLVVLGLIGGALYAGVVGLFLGPVILAVTYALVREWAAEERERLADAGDRAAE
ncbi:MAG: AI-2E family transporter [Alphaproteobacteria bacterium]